MKKYIKNGIFALCMALTVPALTSCDNDDDYDTNQYVGGVNLNSYGPSPVARGGQLRFLGSGMNQITKITLPGSGDITEIERVSNEEIRIAVPQNAEPGVVTLHYAGGTIETKTLLTFLEPISIDEIAPLRVKAGETIAIKGEYLNLIKEVCFSFTEGTDSVNVFAEDFLSHDRKAISLVVPERAVSGTIFLSDAKEMPNMIESEMALEIILPAPSEVKTLESVKAGDKIKVEGKDFDLVKAVKDAAGNDVEYTFTPGENGAADVIELTLNDNTPDGAIVAITVSDVEVALVNVGMAVPANLVVEPAADLRAGDIVTIKGLNLDQVVSLVFPGVADAVAPATVSNGELTVIYPAGAKTGNVVLNLKSGKTVEILLSYATPDQLGFNPSPVSAGAELTISGRNLDVVKAIGFEGVEVPVEVTPASAAEIKVVVPALAKNGKVTFYLDNEDTSVSENELAVEAPICAFIVSMDTEEPTAGELMLFTISNGDKLTSVLVNGQAVQYIANGDKLYVNLPSTCGPATKIALVSSNGTLEYEYDIIPATHVANVIWEDIFNLGNWDGGGLRLYKEDFQGIPAGAKLVFYLTAAADAQIQLNNANWGQFAIVDVPAGATTAEYVLSADDLTNILTTDDGWSTTAIVVNGHTAVISKIAVEYERSMETAIWEGAWESGNWGGNQDLAWGSYDWSTVKAGSILRLYITPMVADPANDWWCVALRHGDGWNMLPAPCPDQWGQPVSGVCELELTQGIIDDLVANGGLVITGADFTLTKVTLE